VEHGGNSGGSEASNARASRPYNPYVPSAYRHSNGDNATANSGVTHTEVSQETNTGETHTGETHTGETYTGETHTGETHTGETHTGTVRRDHDRADRRQNNGYGVVYGYPWYPFSYGWGDGWYGGYGTQYGYPGYSYNSNYPFDIPYAEYNNDESLAANPPNPNAVDAQSATTLVNPYDQQAVQARQTNAVDKSPAMIQANSTVAQTQSAFDAERERVLAALAQKPDYQAAVARRHQAAKEVHQATTQPGGQPSSALSSAANDKMEAADEVTKMEAQAIAADPAASAAKAKMEQALADRDALRAQLMSQTAQPR
jgi:hypothetical protein